MHKDESNDGMAVTREQVIQGDTRKYMNMESIEQQGELKHWEQFACRGKDGQSTGCCNRSKAGQRDDGNNYKKHIKYRDQRSTSIRTSQQRGEKTDKEHS